MDQNINNHNGIYSRKETSVISVIRGLQGVKNFSKCSMKFQVKSFQVELR